MAIFLGNREYLMRNEVPLNPYTLILEDDGLYVDVELRIRCDGKLDITDLFRLDGVGPFSPRVSVSQVLDVIEKPESIFRIEPLDAPYHEGCSSFCFEIEPTSFDKISFSLCRVASGAVALNLEWTGQRGNEDGHPFPDSEAEEPFSINESLAPLRIQVHNGVKIPDSISWSADRYGKGRFLNI